MTQLLWEGTGKLRHVRIFKDTANQILISGGHFFDLNMPLRLISRSDIYAITRTLIQDSKVGVIEPALWDFGTFDVDLFTGWQMLPHDSPLYGFLSFVDQYLPKGSLGNLQNFFISNSLLQETGEFEL